MVEPTAYGARRDRAGEPVSDPFARQRNPLANPLVGPRGYLGGGDAFGLGIAVDAQGYAYTVGAAFSNVLRSPSLSSPYGGGDAWPRRRVRAQGLDLIVVTGAAAK